MITTAQILGQNTEHLVQCQGHHFLHPQVCKSFKQMQHAASSDGINIQIASGHRDFYRQALIWQRKWQGQLPLYDLSGELLEGSVLSESEKMHAILTWSALPGTSRHHWGTDLDVYDSDAIAASGAKLQLVSAEYAANGPCYALNCWLGENAEKFDFSRPYIKFRGGVAAEAWHLSYHPMASEIFAELDVNIIRDNIVQSELAGKDTVLANLDMIFSRYIQNKGDI
jgi:LAS superfamily LD-carboxypeptidase LdcB